MEVEKLREKLEITGSDEESANEETIDETILSENSLTYRKRFEVSPKFQYITIEEENLRNDAENIINSDYTLLDTFNVVKHDDGQKTVVSVETSPDNNFEQEFRHVLDRYIDHLMMDGADFQESYQRGSELATENIFFRIGETLGKMADEGYVPARPGADDAFFVQGEPRITNITEFGNSMRGLYHIGLVERDEYSEPDFQREVDASLEILSKTAREVPEISFRTAYESAQEGYMNKF